MIDQIKELRQKTDAIYQEGIGINKTRETSLGLTAIQLGFMWMGKFLGVVGSANPYPESTNADSPIIEPPADKADEELRDLKSLDSTVAVKTIRGDIDNLIGDLKTVLSDHDTFNPTLSQIEGFQALIKLQEAKMWFGQELNNIYQTKPAPVEEIPVTEPTEPVSTEITPPVEPVVVTEPVATEQPVSDVADTEKKTEG